MATIGMVGVGKIGLPICENHYWQRTSCDTSGSPVTRLICDTKRWATMRLIGLRPA
jgi:hypothetical protein